MSYVPQLNDYVQWKELSGWVYFVSEYYITIEIGVKCMDENTKQCSLHEKTHTLVVCYPEYYHELTYVKTRANKYGEK